MPRIIFKNCPEKVKNYPEKKLPKTKTFLPRKENLPNTCSPANVYLIYLKITQISNNITDTTITFIFVNEHPKLCKIHLPVSRGREGVPDAPGVEPRGSEPVPGGGRGGDPGGRGGSRPEVCPESPVRDRHGPRGSARGGGGCGETCAPRGGRWHGAPEGEAPVPRVLSPAQPDT